MALAQFINEERGDEDELVRIQKLNEFEASGQETGTVNIGSSEKVFSTLNRYQALRKRLDLQGDYFFNVNLYHTPDTKSPKPNPIDLYKITPEAKAIYDRIQKVSDRDLRDVLTIRFFQLIEFDFAKVADYYVKCNDEIKELMEDMAMVVIDYECAIKNGFFDIAKSVNDFGEIKCNNTVFAERNKIDGKKPQGLAAAREEAKKEKDKVEKIKQKIQQKNQKNNQVDRDEGEAEDLLVEEETLKATKVSALIKYSADDIY